MIKCVYTTLALLLLFQTPSRAKEIKYPVNEIPDSLKTNAKIVIRNKTQQFTIESAGKAVESVNYAVTILNENGLDYAILSIPYSQKLQKVHTLKGTVFNEAGEKIETLMLDKVIDHSVISGYSLFEDSRVKLYEPKTMTFPFTVEYSYIIDYDGYMSLPVWQPISEYNVSVEKSTFTMICPSDLSFRYIEKNIPKKVEASKSDRESSYKWEADNMIALVEEPFSGPFSDFCPTVICAPNDFEVEGFKGNLASWENFGKWIALLNEGRDELSVETKANLLDKVKDCTSDYEKARLVYEYMQQKTRYLNVTVGIGGWRPIPAETVDRLGYGDCKALSNYTKSLLNAVGIQSFYTLINAGKRTSEILTDFPNNQFNHVILCLPLVNDTIWMECTSQHLPFGYIGSFTDDRDALVISGNGGKIIHSRIYSASENQLIRNSILRLDATGNATLISTSLHGGILYDDKLGLFLSGTEDKKKMILDEVNLPGALLKKFDYQEIRTQVPAIKENLEIEIPRYGTISGTRMIVALLPLDRQREVPKKVNNRKSNVVIRRAVVSVDSVMVMIPDGYQVESVPGEISAESKFGAYSLRTVATGNKIVCVRRLEFIKGKNSREAYNELIDFYKKIAAADNSKISLKKV